MPDASASTTWLPATPVQVNGTRVDSGTGERWGRPRIVTRFGEREARAAALLLLALPGPAFVYQGQELGLEEVELANELRQDPIFRRSAGARLVGVNNRSLKTLDVDVALSERLAPRIPPSVTAVSESGLRSAADLDRLNTLGYRAFLIGERFMTTPDPGRALAELLAGVPR